MDVGDDMDVNYQQTRVAAPYPESSAGGYTVVELMVVLLVSGILLGTALPAFSGLLRSQQLTQEINALVADLNFTRSEAVKRARRVHLCKSADQATCSADAQWEDGWIVFPDRDRSGERDPDEPVLRAHGPLPPGYTIRFQSFYATDYIRYYPDGHAANTGTFMFCTPEGSARALIIFRGRLRVDRVDGSGNGLECPE